MPQPELIALVGASYGVTIFSVHRMGVWRRRAEGPDLGRLRTFDTRVLARDLDGVYRAGLPREAAVPVEWKSAEATGFPAFSAESPWESPSLVALRNSRDALFAGEPVQPLPGPEFISLTLHAWTRSLSKGDLPRARAVADGLSESAPTIAAKLTAYTDCLAADLARARGEDAEAYRTASKAVARLRALGSRATDADLSSRYLDAYLQLTQLTNGWNLEYALFVTSRFLRRAVRDCGHEPCLYLGLALATALAGKSDEAVDELGRAVYYAQGDPFYAAIALKDDYVARVRPALVAQCKAASRPLAPRENVS